MLLQPLVKQRIKYLFRMRKLCLIPGFCMQAGPGRRHGARAQAARGYLQGPHAGLLGVRSVLAGILAWHAI